MALIKLAVDPEFRDVLPPLPADVFEALAASIKTEGCRDPIVTWGSTIVDGHNRYNICSAYGLPFTTVPFYGGPDFDYLPSMAAKRDAVKMWIIGEQLNRRNLTDEQRELYIGKLYKSKKAAHGDAERLQSPPSGHAAPLERTSAKIAKDYHINEKTVRRAEKFADGMDEIGKVSPEVRDKILSGAGRPYINRGDVRGVGRAPEKAIQIIKAVLNKEPLAKPDPPSGHAVHLGKTATTTLAAAAPAAAAPTATPCAGGTVPGSHSVSGAAVGGGDLYNYPRGPIVADIDAIIGVLKNTVINDSWSTAAIEAYHGAICRLSDVAREQQLNIKTAATGRGIYLIDEYAEAMAKEVHAADLVPPDVERPEAVSWYADDFLAGVADMTNEQAGAYARLLSLQQSKGPLTKEQMLSVTPDKFVHKKFYLRDDGTYINPRMEKEVKARLAHQAAQRDRANKRWNGNGNGNGNGNSNGAVCRGNAAALPVFKDLKIKTSLGLQKDVTQDALSQSNNIGVLSFDVDVKDKTVGVTDGAGAGADEFNQLPPEEDFNQAEAGGDPAEALALTMPPKAAKEPRKQRGPHGWVKLTDAEYGRLLDEFGRAEVTKRIAYVDECAKMKGNAQKWKDWNLVIRKSIREKWGEKPYGQAGKPLTAGRTVYEFERKAIESGKYDNLRFDNE